MMETILHVNETLENMSGCVSFLSFCKISGCNILFAQGIGVSMSQPQFITSSLYAKHTYSIFAILGIVCNACHKCH